MERQTLVSQKGEIEFRRQLVKQQINGQVSITGEYDEAIITNILKERMIKTRDDMQTLMQQTFSLSPYIEIGAERCQRSLVMENDLGLEGAAVDISFDMLNAGKHYAKIFNIDKIPLRICCDAHNLPFKTGSIPFAFCYETLHHFPEPSPIVGELHRVISPGGYFYFDEEPYKKILHLNLYRTHLIHSEEAKNVGIIRKVFDYFLADSTCNEVDYGIIENDKIPLSTWKKALNIFIKNDLTIYSARTFKTKLFNQISLLSYIPAILLGGTISGLSRKEGRAPNEFPTIYETLICPNCLVNQEEFSIGRSDDSYYCPTCKIEYRIINGVLFLFTQSKMQELYPEFSGAS